MKNIKIGCLFFVLTISLVSCAGKKPVVVQNSVTTERLVTETVHDTVFTIEKDSASYNALLECINGKIVIKDVLQAEPGRNLKSPKVRIADNLLKVDCQARAQELFAQWKSTYISQNKREKIEVPVEVPIVTNKLTNWQEIQIRGFWLLVAIFALVIWLTLKNILKKTT